MALGYTVRRRGTFGDLSYRIVDVTLDNAYVNGSGYTLDPKQMGFGTNGQILFALPTPVADGFLLEWAETATGGTLKVRDSSGSVGAATPEAANNLAALNGVVARVLAMGIGQG